MVCENCTSKPGKLVKVNSIKDPRCIVCKSAVSSNPKYTINDLTFGLNTTVTFKTSEGTKKGIIRSVTELNDRFLIAIERIEPMTKIYSVWKKCSVKIEKGE
jgi:hypothetical protein